MPLIRCSRVVGTRRLCYMNIEKAQRFYNISLWGYYTKNSNIFGSLDLEPQSDGLSHMLDLGGVVNTPWIYIRLTPLRLKTKLAEPRPKPYSLTFRIMIAATYYSRKSALINTSEALRLELSSFSISVIIVLTGIVDR